MQKTHDLPREKQTRTQIAHDLPREKQTRTQKAQDLPREKQARTEKAQDLPREKQTRTQKAQDLPREKLNRKGAAALTDIELLQAVIGSGGKDNDFKQIAKNLDAVIQKVGAAELTIEDVKSVKGIGEAKATTVFAALEFWRRKFTKNAAPLIDCAEKAAMQMDGIKDKKQEYFVVLTLDGARRLINNRTVSIGTLMNSLVHPREVFSPAIEDRAASIIIGHNHPSGMLEVSSDDREVSRRIKQAGDLLGIKLDDHIIVSREGFASAM
ncbi:MAG: DNA repair protein RadC [Oscillospiraceae bacterium]|nr:DNA repair protein RadC [Oscillospiraceae bacterium]